MTTTNKWISATKKYASSTGQSYGKSLQDKDHRISYHYSECDKKPSMKRGGTLLPYHHPAMHPVLTYDHSTATPAVIKARKEANDKQKDNRINYLKHLRKTK